MSISQKNGIEISSLDELIELLEDGQFETVTSNIAKSNILLSDYDAYMHFSSKHYFRNCIAKNEDYELILLCWEVNQKTAIHCHDDKECFVQILSGKIKEEHYSYDEEKKEMVHQSTEVLKSGDTSFIDDGKVFHSLHNVANTKAASLHLYMKPIHKCNVFDPDTGDLLERSMRYNSYQGEIV